MACRRGLFSALGQNLVVNPSFESGTTDPAPWVLAGPGNWESFGRSGSRCVGIVGARDSLRTWHAPLAVETNQSYWVRFWCSSSNALSGYSFGGISTAAHDFSRPSKRWTDYAYAAWVPNAGAPEFNLSSWDADGLVFFDDAEVLPLTTVLRRTGDYDLGDGESLAAGRYTFTAPFTSFGGNCSRAVHHANTAYNTTRWYFNNGSEVVYRHELAGQTFSNATVFCGILNYNNLTNTTLIVEAGTDGVTWQPAGSLTQSTGANLPLSGIVPPANVVWVRLRSTNAYQFALTQYSFAADVPDTTTTATGRTLYFGQLNPATGAQVADIQNTVTGRVATLLIPNLTASARTFECSAATTAGSIERDRTMTIPVAATSTNSVALLIPTAGMGDNNVVITVRDTADNSIVFQQIHRFTVDLLSDDSFGELLPSPADCPAWTCSGNYKVGRTRWVPRLTNSIVNLAAARNEYEPFQLVLRPPNTLTNVTLSIGAFVSITNPAVTISGTNVTIERVDYVNVAVPDPENFASVLGDHPDPLPPYDGPFTAPGETNSPLWFTVHVPKDAPAGDYDATISVQYAGGSFSVAVRLHVFDFALTEVTHSRSLYGVTPQLEWHGLGFVPTPDHLAIWELYMQNMARHRVSPFVPYFYTPVAYWWNAATNGFDFNFAPFDEAMERYLEEYNFNAFRDASLYTGLPEVPGMLTYNAGRTALLPEYRAAYPKLMQPIMQHFRERGWMGIGVAHWFDEPASFQVPLVLDGMHMIEEAGPDHPRMLAGFYSPMTELFGAVNLWVPHIGYDSQYQHFQPRREAGDELWYYVCTTPKDPWPNNFIDQPGLSPRIRQWYAESLQVQGEDYWGINYYLGMTNPWTETMTRGQYPGGFQNLGNGDGNLVYPPVRVKPTNTVVVAGPVNSVRYEVTRDAYEDREYFWLLKRLLSVQEPVLGTNAPSVIEGHAAYAAAMEILSWPPIYPYEPYLLEAARTRVALAIEALDDGTPFIAKDPLSKVVAAGGAERLRVEAVGWPPPSIQWQHEGTNLPGATAAKLSLTNLTTDWAGAYRAIASNIHGSITSAVGRLTILVTNQPPVIIKHPVGVTRTNMDRVVFGVGASSLTPVWYQWLYQGAAIGGATNATVLLPSVNAGMAGQYAVVVSNSFGVTTSTPALLNMQVPSGTFAAQITSSPTNLTVAVGQNVQITPTVAGSLPIAFQWFFNGTPVATGTNSSVLSLTNVQTSQGGAYQLAAANVLGSVTNLVASLTVQVMPPSILAQPAGLTVAQGQNAQFYVTATGTAPLAYQWFFNDTNVIASANASSVLITNVQPAQSGNYVVRITNSAGSITSTPALLQLAGMPSYSNQPPIVSGLRQGNTASLVLAPDNRTRTVLTSSNLSNWVEYQVVGPTAAQVTLNITVTNPPVRFFRVFVTP